MSPSTQHLYLYCANNPINYEDPSGHIAISRIVGGIIGGAAGAFVGSKIAKKTNAKGWKKVAIIAGCAVGGALVGAVAGPRVAKVAKRAVRVVKQKLPTKKVASAARKAASKTKTAAKKTVSKAKQVISKSKSKLADVKSKVKAKKSGVKKNYNTGKGAGGAKNFEGKRNPSADFQNAKGKSTLNNHVGRHGSDFGYNTPKEYLDGARNFLEKNTTSTTKSFVSSEGTYFRYDTATNEFGIINKYGGISTYFKPADGITYWLDQLKLYGPK